MNVRRTVLLCMELGCLASIGASRLAAQARSAIVRSSEVVAQVSARDSARARQSRPSTAPRITLRLHDVALKDALRQIAKQGGIVLFYNDRDIPAGRRVSVTIADATVPEALRVVLHGTGLTARPTAAGIVIERQAAPPPRTEPHEQQGAIRGWVTDARTGEGIAGASVRIDGTRLGAITGDSGEYRIGSVAPGRYTLTARRLGYQSASDTVAVTADEQATVDFALHPVPTLLDRVVVAGTIVPTTVRALPTPVTVITAADIAQRHPHSIQELIRQAVPGAVSWDLAASPTQTSFSVRGASTLTPGLGQMKIFLDGIEVVSPTSAAVDPSSIGRIEVIRGPEAATLYGPDAAGGVILISTKRGAEGLSGPQVNAEAAVGIIQTPYAGYRTAWRERYVMSVEGGAPNAGYSLGADYSHTGAWVVDGKQSNRNAYGGVRFARGPIALDVSGRYQVSNDPNLFRPEVYETGFVYYSKPLYQPAQIQNQTVGARLGIAPTSWWQNTITVGIDRLLTGFRQTRPRFTTPADSLLSVYSQRQAKTSIGYSASIRGALGSALSVSLIAGFDHYSLPVTRFSTAGALNTDGMIQTVAGQPMTASWTSTENTGYFTQAELGVHQTLYLTAGLRADRNSNFGKELGTPVSPRAGVSYVHDVGAATLKLRASYGRAIRAPSPTQKIAAVAVVGGNLLLANPRLGPERQHGWDAGVDAVLGAHGSLSVTYYDQTADDLIQQVPVPSDSIPSYQYQNVGRVENTGVEVEGTLSLDLLRLSANYGYARARIASLGPGYTGDLRPGDQSLDTPKHTAGASLAITPRTGPNVSVGLTYVGSWNQYDYLAQFRCFGDTGPCQPGPGLRNYIIAYPSLVKLNATVSQQITRTIAGFISVDNLTNNEASEFLNFTPVMGRITTIGVRFHY